MKIAGSYVIDAPREAVWQALNDIEVLARTIPGCQKLDQTGENTFETTLKVGLQAVKGVYNGTITLSDIQPPHHYNIAVDGKGSNGFLRGLGGIELVEEADGKTKINYSGDANIGGTLATVGQRLIEGAARTMINQSLKAFTAQMETRMAAADGDAGDTAGAPATDVAAAVAEPVVGAEPAAAVSEPTPAVAPVAEAPAAVAAPVERYSAISPNGVTASAPVPIAAPAAPPRRTVVVPEHEQLKPESLVLGVAQDFFKERPWVPWVLVAFLLGWIFGRGRS